MANREPANGQPRPRVVVIGGGFAGLSAARVLARRGAGVDVTMLDRANHHLFQPLLYQVATAVLNPADIASPLRQLLRKTNVTVLLADVRSVDPHRKVVVCRHGDVPYDRLIVAAGASHSYFGHDQWLAYAPGLKVIEDALEMRRRILLAFELAEREADDEQRRAWMAFVVVGGGPTGVELAGALAEISRHSLRHEFRNIDPRQARVVLLEGTPRLLAAWPESLSEVARRDLERLGVEVKTSAFVTDIDEDGVRFCDTHIRARTVLWSAGVRASPLGASLGGPLDSAGRVRVTPELMVPAHDDIFVAGDLAAVFSDGKPVPGLAPAAKQEGRHAAENLLRGLRGQPARPFRYRDRGAFAVIGRGTAVGVALRRWKLDGVFAWVAWLAIHIVYLVGFRNRAAVLLEWAYVFFTRRRPLRLITGRHPGQPVDELQVTSPASAGERRPGLVHSAGGFH